MAIRDMLRVSRKTFLNPSGWLDFQGLRNNTAMIVSVLRTLFTTPKPLREETFEQSMARLHLTETDVSTIAINYRQYALFFLVLGFLGFIYSFFILFLYWSFLGWLLGMGMTALFISQAFKYDFWSLQMRRRKLGLTYGDWKTSVFGTKGAST